MPNQGTFHTCMDAKDANGQGIVLDVDAYRQIAVQIIAANSCNGLLKCQGSLSATQPDWSASPSLAAPWSYKYMISQDDRGVMNGSDGMNFSVLGDGVWEMRVDVLSLRWINFDLSGITTGDVTVIIRPVNFDRLLG